MGILAQRTPVEAPEWTLTDTTWFRRVFGAVAGVCILFVVLTTAAMAAYPGGTAPITSTHGYTFLLNSFSDLGQTRTQSGASNVPSMLLFSVAMLMVGAGAGTFFVAFARYFATHVATPVAQRLNRAATIAGLISATFFAVVGLTPHNVLLPEHQIASNGAFYLLLLAVLLELAALWRLRSIPTALLRVNIAFVVILAAYVLVMTFGPSPATLVGDAVHVIAQKLIVYIAIATIFSQAIVIRAHVARPRPAYATTR